MELTDAIERNRVDKVELIKGPRPRQLGSLVLTGHHLIFAPELKEGETASNDLWLLHRVVDRVLIEQNSPSPDAASLLHLKCKNFLICTFVIQNRSDCSAVARSIERLSNLNIIEFEYPFYYTKSFEVLDDGWKAFNIDHQYASLTLHCPERWRISNVNLKYEVCPSYPELVIVPRGIGDDFLRISATYRDGSRFPVLSYYHPPSQSCIIRCSQPLVSPTNRRCKEDEVIINSLINPNCKGVIFDTRSEAVANSSRGRGGGKEPRYHYSQWSYIHGNLPRIKEYRESFAKLIEAVTEYSDSEKWLSKLGGSLWLQYVSESLTSAASIAQWIHCGKTEIPVIIHGGEGVDTTLLVSSLAQILLDPDSRTIRGFQAVIESEWIAAGHPFATRCAHSAFAQGSLTGPYESPIFICFLDCIWQLMRQYPSCFEFTAEFLVFLAEHAYASEFGSFLGNHEQDKTLHGIKEKTTSLWSYVNHPKILADFMNVLYKPFPSVLFPSVAAQSIVLWERFYLRWQENWSVHDRMYAKIASLKARETELRGKLMSKRCSADSSAKSPSNNSISELEAKLSNAI